MGREAQASKARPTTAGIERYLEAIYALGDEGRDDIVPGAIATVAHIAPSADASELCVGDQTVSIS
ncbi:MAG: hypothetical protein OXE05_10920 [Chloroflexi bacterium]|nr:hypothetical protein [Chloroflexota bacterium]